HLRYFKAVADELNFTRAASRLRVAQSAISSQIQDLEGELGVVLLERSRRRVRLTAAGQAFVEAAERILRSVEDASHQARRIGHGEYGTLAVGFIGAQSHEWMPRVLKRFRAKFPEVEVTLTELHPSQQLEALFARTLDVGLVGPIAGKPPAGLCLECFSEERPFVALPNDHRFARLPEVSLAQLKNEPFILTSEKNSPNYRSLIARMCERAGFTPRVVQEVDRARTGVQYVAAGFGISIFAEHISRLPTPGVRFVPLSAPVQKLRYGIAWRKGAEEVVARFVEYVKQQFKAR
ncbi:MAG: LysR family transcriptional regulator, partial [Verrucomicrobia bacterium]|nr:LysR family transcriptional regulator [Verrucomicrobiota bacterium]